MKRFLKDTLPSTGADRDTAGELGEKFLSTGADRDAWAESGEKLVENEETAEVVTIGEEGNSGELEGIIV